MAMTKKKVGGPMKVKKPTSAPSKLDVDFMAMFRGVVSNFAIAQADSNSSGQMIQTEEELKGFSDRLDWIIARHMGDALDGIGGVGGIPTCFTSGEVLTLNNMPIRLGDPKKVFDIADLPRVPHGIPIRLGNPEVVFYGIPEMPHWA